jgi:hypothetical protein
VFVAGSLVNQLLPVGKPKLASGSGFRKQKEMQACKQLEGINNGDNAIQ